MKKTQLIILAGGSGERFGGELPKQFIKIAGKTIIEHTIEKMEHSLVIDSLIIVVNEKYYEYMNEIVLRNHFKKVKKIILGGNSRQESSYAGIHACDCDTDNLLFHDAIRPFISEKILNDVVEALNTYEAVDVAIPCADTIVKVNDNMVIEDIPNRKYLMRGQTPQGFRLSLIKRAYERYIKDKEIAVTDDCGIIAYYKMADIYVVEGEEQNIKITYREDAYLADKLFQINSMKMVENIEEQQLVDQLKDQVGVIFGHTSGIGKDIYDLMKLSGGKVYGFSRSNLIDVANYEEVEGALHSVWEKEGNIDYVINTSGQLSIQKLETMKSNEIGQMTMTNYLGSVYITKASIPYLKHSKGSVILFTSSSYTRGRAMYSIYSSTKAAIVNFAQAISEEIYEDGIRINVMNPERTNTPMRRKNFGIEPEGTLLDSKKVAIETMKTVCSSITGQVVDVRK
ncbi:MAG TPA: 2-C-methyl-D-erythritol 4-phosphate cytidylyltransferase [Lachnospiraceae bacterium]|nr:2-C-methyl-D-erythritol 4-phosphate cytidylyltransferase [Lachnospiraceae bacterium]